MREGISPSIWNYNTGMWGLWAATERPSERKKQTPVQRDAETGGQACALQNVQGAFQHERQHPLVFGFYSIAQLLLSYWYRKLFLLSTYLDIDYKF